MNPRYPIYIISKGRWEKRLTSKMLERMSVPYRIVVEPSEFNKYTRNIDESKILVLPDDFSKLKKGSIPVRNWVWEHSLKEGYDKTNDRLEFAKSLQRQHPDVVKVVRKYNRWHHLVDYNSFKYNLLIKSD